MALRLEPRVAAPGSSAPPAAGRSRRRPAPLLRRPPAPPTERLLGIGSVLLLAVFSPSTYSGFWLPKFALLLAVVVPGAIALVRAARVAVPGARAGALLLGVALLSSILADRPLLSLLGQYTWGTGWLFLVAVAGAWALGRSLPADAADRLGRTVVGGVIACAAFAWIQMGTTLPIEMLAQHEGRASSFIGNSVHLGALAGAGLAYLAVVVARAEVTSARLLALLGAAFVLAGAVELSGSRISLAIAAACVVVVVARARTAVSLLVVAAAVAGIALAGLLPVAEPGLSATARATAPSGSGLAPRAAAWEAGLDGLRERPLLGWGPGRFQTAASPRIGPEVARANGGTGEFTDAHNWLVHTAVTTGAVGVLLLLAWLAPAARRAKGPLAAFAAVGAAVGLLQPQAVVVTPLFALALGASARDPYAGFTGAPFGRGALRRLAAAGALLGIAAGAVLVTGDLALRRAADDFSKPALATADALSPWPVVHDVEWRILAFDAIDSREERDWDRAIDAARRAAEADPVASQAWVATGSVAVAAGDQRAADRHFRRALQANPWSTTALDGLIRSAAERGDAEQVERLCDRRRVVSTDPCPSGAGHARPGGGRAGAPLLP